MKLKKIYITIFIVITAFTIVGCSKKETEKPSVSFNQDVVNPLDTWGQTPQPQEQEENGNHFRIELRSDIDTIAQEITAKNIDNEAEKVQFFVYEQNMNFQDEFTKQFAIEINKDLSREDKLVLLCNAIIETYNNEVAIEIVDIVDNVAIINVAEKYGIENYTKEEALKYTLNKPAEDGDWFDKVVVVYDAGASF